MKCEKCGRKIETVLVDIFNYDGSDEVQELPLVENSFCAYVDAEQTWTGYELLEEEKSETIRCPHCKQFPFKSQEIQVQTIVRVVFFTENDGAGSEAE